MAATSIIGTPTSRIDGPKKTSGRAMYTADFNFPGIVFGIPVSSAVANGRVKKVDTSKARSMRGVLKIYHHENMPKLYRPVPGERGAHVDEKRPPFEDDIIYYSGQYVAFVVAETMEQARAAARAVSVEYEAQAPNTALDLNDGFGDKLKPGSTRGDVDAAFASAPVKIEETYVTPIETHNPMELHASVSVWDGKKFTLYETTQSLVNHRNGVAEILGVPTDNVEVVMKYLGSGFGGKLWPWPHTALAASAARDLNRPVKLVVDRRMMFTSVGHRPRTQQRMRLGATADGKLICLEHDYVSDSSILDEVPENCGEATPYLYSTPNLRVRSSVVHRNVGTPTAMRGPGAVPGLYALESAVDELAIKLKMDPVQFRLLNEPKLDESENKPFSSRHSKECFTLGAERFGWSKRTPKVGSMRRGELVLGWGVAGCSWMAMRMNCKARVSLNNDGTARISCATQDIGGGTYTIFAQGVSAKTGIPVEKIDVELGSSSLPEGPLSGGSWVTGTVLPAISKACDAATKQLVTIAGETEKSPFHKSKPEELKYTNGRIHLKDHDPSSGIGFGELLKMANLKAASGEGNSPATFEDDNAKKYSLHSYGAHFVEVEWDPGIARLRVSRVVSAIDVGRAVNPKTARNQVEGAVVMGVGMGLFEETVYDHRNGVPVNANFADYIVCTNADCPDIDVIFTDYPDTVLNEFGARGVGEIGLAGVAAAITAAVYHATGVRVRELPVRIEKLIGQSKT